MLPLPIITAILLVLGLLLIVAAVRRLRTRRPFSASVQGLGGLLLLSLAALLFTIALNLYTYQVLTHEQAVAEVRFEALGPQHFRMYLLPENDAPAVLQLRGDEWQVDSRVLKWHGLANMVGMKTVYRLERVSGRYRELQQERSAVRTVHALDHERGLDLWALAQKHNQYIPWVDAIYGSAAYMPMVDKARYRISMSTTGLVVRADNAIAQEAIETWK